MIKIDHVCYTCKSGEEDKFVSRVPEYSVVFHEKNLPNLDIKEQLCKCGNKVHEILYLQSDAGVPLEVTIYQHTEPRKNMSIFDEIQQKLTVKTKNVQESIALFQLCGARILECTAAGYLCELKGLFDRTALRIEILYCENSTSWVLDGGGVSCLAIVVQNIEKERKRWLEKFCATEIRTFQVNGKSLKIFFGYRPSGEIIELISI